MACRRTGVILFNLEIRGWGVHAFSQNISLKVYVIEILEFEPAYSDFAVQLVSYDAMWTSTLIDL